MQQTPILKCLATMVTAYEELEMMKSDVKDRCKDAFTRYSGTVEFGDDPPTQKAMEKLAKAQAVDKMGQLSDELKALANALLQCTGEVQVLLHGEETK